MGELIGHQDGIAAEYNRLRDLDPGGTLLTKQGGKWPSLETIETIPLEQWKAYDKAERRARILKDDHDAAVTQTPGPSPEPPPVEPTPPDPATTGYAPQSYNRGSRGQNAKFNIRINCTGGGEDYVDRNGIHYDSSGLCKGGRTEPEIPGLKPSDMSDGLEPWEPYTWNGVTYPPYPLQSYEK